MKLSEQKLRQIIRKAINEQSRRGKGFRFVDEDDVKEILRRDLSSMGFTNVNLQPVADCLNQIFGKIEATGIFDSSDKRSERLFVAKIKNCLMLCLLPNEETLHISQDYMLHVMAEDLFKHLLYGM